MERKMIHKNNRGMTLVQLLAALGVLLLLLLVIIPSVSVGLGRKAENERLESARLVGKTIDRVFAEAKNENSLPTGDGVILIEKGKADETLPFAKLVAARLKDAQVENLRSSEILLTYKNADTPVALLVSFEEGNKEYIFKYPYDETERLRLMSAENYDDMDEGWFACR